MRNPPVYSEDQITDREVARKPLLAVFKTPEELAAWELKLVALWTLFKERLRQRDGGEPPP